MLGIKRSIKLLSILGLVLASFQAAAWGQVGHRAVCELAYEKMQPTTQREIKRLLKELPSIHKQRLNDYQKRSKRSKIDYAAACVWADAIRELPEYKGFASWHYVNVERDAKSVNSGLCLNNCVLEAIPLHQRVLAQTNNSWQKLQALMFLGHWVGDIHQPLHVGFADDLGGNVLELDIDGVRTNFHRLWDSQIIAWMMKLNAWNEEAFIENIDVVNTIGFDTGFSLNAAAVWAEESRAIAQAPATGYCYEKKSECRRPKGRPPYRLEGTYYAQQWPIVRLRLKLAAERLAHAVDQAMN